MQPPIIEQPQLNQFLDQAHDPSKPYVVTEGEDPFMYLNRGVSFRVGQVPQFLNLIRRPT